MENRNIQLSTDELNAESVQPRDINNLPPVSESFVITRRVNTPVETSPRYSPYSAFVIPQEARNAI